MNSRFSLSTRLFRTGLISFCLLVGAYTQKLSADEIFVPASVKGWYNHAGGHTAVSHFTGFTGSATHRAYHAYSFATPVPGKIWAVQLWLFNPASGYVGDVNETLNIYEVTTPIATLASGTGGVPAFNDLVDGTVYGGALVDASFNGFYVVMNLSGTFVGLADTANSSGGDVALGTSLVSLACCYPQYVFGFSGAGGSFLKVFYEPCGNGVIGPTETCDDGNTNSSDGCSSSCQVEAGYFCSGTPSVCFPDCNSNSIDDGTENLTVRYVDASAVGANNGSSWANAYTSLQSALDIAALCSVVEEIWVADGTYKPTFLTGSPDPRTATFRLQSGLAIYGGFVGTETMLSQRDPVTNLAVLSGDLGIPVNTGDNAYHVVSASGVDATAVLDGFTVRDGMAQGAGPEENGAGLYFQNSSPVIRSCVVRNNDAPLPNGRGGGGYVNGGAPQFEDCEFRENFAQGGGALRVLFSSPTFTDCLFDQNEANTAGALSHSDSGTSIIIRGVFTSNIATNLIAGFGGGAIQLQNGAACSISDSDFTGNSSNAGGGAILAFTHAPNPTTQVDIANSRFENNEGQQGGAIHLSGNVASSGEIRNCDFYSNTGHQGGGAAHVRDGSTAIFEECTFRSNGSGGADAGVLYAYQGQVEVRSSKFLGNTSGNDGGAIAIAENSSLTVLNSLFSGNSSAQHGGAINMTQSTTAPFASISNCTFATNQAGNSFGGAVHVGRGGMNVRNTIFWDNIPSNRQIYISGGGVPTYVDIDYSDVMGGTGGIEGAGDLIYGSSNWSVDPLFRDADGADETSGTMDDDYRLGDLTRCIDAGHNSIPESYSLTTDLDGNDRFVDSPLVVDAGGGSPPIVDIGAYEWIQDCNDNRIEDAEEIATCAGDPACEDCNLNGRPDECDLLKGVASFAEDFDLVSGLGGSGWAAINRSSPLGAGTWFQGNPASFSSFNGATNSYVGVNFQSSNGPGTDTISNWLLMPTMTIQDGTQLSFYTRTIFGSIFPDRLEVRLSKNGASTDVGGTATSVGDFATVLLEINPMLIVGGYPEGWTQFQVTVAGTPIPTTGRFAFRYFVTDGGPLGVNSNYIGIDAVVVQQPTDNDCNDNLIPDECEVPPIDMAGLDCNSNGTPDECDIGSGFSTDNNSNFVPDECDPMEIIWNSDPLSPLRANRSITVSVALPVASGGLGSNAIQVRMIDLQNPVPANAPCCPPQDFGSFESATCTAAGETGGCNRWVGPVQSFFENTLNPGAGTFRGARLQCSPYYFDWTTEGEFSVFGAEIVPSSSYEIRTFGSSCKGNEGSCSSVSGPVNVLTRRWGDIGAAFQPPGGAAQPDALDVITAVNKFRNLSTAASKRIALIKGNSADPNVDVDALDIVAVVDAFRGFRFPFSGPCICPSTFVCGATACTADGQCPGGSCVKTCTGGTNDGLACITNGGCPGGTCGSGACRDRCGRCRN